MRPLLQQLRGLTCRCGPSPYSRGSLSLFAITLSKLMWDTEYGIWVLALPQTAAWAGPSACRPPMGTFYQPARVQGKVVHKACLPAS